MKIPYIAAVPFVGQESQWPEKAQQEYRRMLDSAIEVVYVCSPGYAPEKFIMRDHWVVEHINHLIAVYDGVPHGGTALTVKYAEELKLPISFINPKDCPQ